MSLISLQGVTKRVESRPLFTGLDLTFDEASRVGLVGQNGCGKSTLLAILAGRSPPDDGRVVTQRGLKVALVEQFVPEGLGPVTAFEAIAATTEGWVDRDTTGYLVDHWCERVGIPVPYRGMRLAQLSGGWLNRVLLARALASNPGFLILDEPTNHMDSESIVFFERLLTEEVTTPFCLVSHDRTLLDRCTRETIFLRHGRLARFTGGYSSAREQLLHQEQAAAERRAAEQKEVNRLVAAAKQLANWGRIYSNEKFARRARNIERRADRLRDKLTFVGTERKAQIQLDTQEARARFMVQTRGLLVGPVPGVTLFGIEELAIRKGDRVAILGVNGAGKTTMLARLVADFAARDSGLAQGFSFNPQVTLGYYDQQLATMDLASTVFRVMRDTFPTLPDDRLRAELIAAGFLYDRLQQVVGTLSGGERARLRLLQLKLQQPNLLVLDEPTNHIDVEGCEELERQILEGGMTCVMVSHDRRFLANVASRFLLILDGKLRELDHLDDYYDYLEACADEQAAPRVAPERAGDAAGPDEGREGSAPEALMARIDRHERQLEIEKGRTARKRSDAAIARIQGELQALYRQLEAQLGPPDA